MEILLNKIAQLIPYVYSQVQLQWGGVIPIDIQPNHEDFCTSGLFIYRTRNLCDKERALIWVSEGPIAMQEEVLTHEFAHAIDFFAGRGKGFASTLYHQEKIREYMALTYESFSKLYEPELLRYYFSKPAEWFAQITAIYLMGATIPQELKAFIHKRIEEAEIYAQWLTHKNQLAHLTQSLFRTSIILYGIYKGLKVNH